MDGLARTATLNHVSDLPADASSSPQADLWQPAVPGRQAPASPSMARPQRRWGWMGVGLDGVALLGTGGALWSSGQAMVVSKPVAGEAPALAVTVAFPVRQNVARQTELTGQFSAVDQVTVLAQVSGYLTDIKFKDGQLVKKGDLLFVIDRRPYEIQLQQAVAEYQTVAATLALATRQVGRTAQLNHEQFASDELLDQRTEAQRAAAASVQTAAAAIHAAQLNLEFTRIVAPFNGRMSARRVSIGSLISGGAAATAQTPLSTIVSVDPIHLDFDMSEADYAAYERSATRRPGGVGIVVPVSLDGDTPWSRRLKAFAA